LFSCLLMFAACGQTPVTGTVPMTFPPDTTPQHYTSHVYFQGKANPDDLAFDPQGHVVFSDGVHGTVERINADGSATVLVKGLARPEGVVVLSDNTIIIAEQKTNRILSLAPGATSATVLRTLPGKVSSAPCK